MKRPDQRRPDGGRIYIVQIEIASCSYQGGRDYNEDCVRHLEQNGVCVVAVADGLGGHGGGHIASSITAEVITRTFFKTPSMDPEFIHSLFELANIEVVKAQTPAEMMRSTGVALFVMGSQALWGHAGDSRIYYFRDGRLIYQTLDHSVSQMAVFSGEITKDEIRTHSDRNRVLKAFGEDGALRPEVSPVFTLEPGWHSFLLCTDGFWEYILENEMETDLTESENPHYWIHAMLKRITGRVPRDTDNYSAAAVYVKG